MCKAKQWDMSAESLTSAEADRALSTYLAKDAILRDEVSRHHQTVDALSTLANDVNEPGETDDHVINDSDIDIADLIKAVAEIDLTPTQAAAIAVPGAQTVQSELVKPRSQSNPYGAGLGASGAYESMWAWDDKGEMFGEERMPVQAGDEAAAPENDGDGSSDESSDIEF